MSDRFLQLRGPRLAFVDSREMKLSFPLAKNDETRVQLAPDFRHAVLYREDGVYVANVVTP